MTGPQAIQAALNGATQLWQLLTEDLSDADLLVRPVPGANHVAWQWGHVIAAEHRFLKALGVDMPALPERFTERHAKDTAQADPPTGFLTRDEYARLYNAVRTATLAAVGQLTEADLDRPNAGPMAPLAPTMGALYLLVASHSTMHAGQVSVLRRKLGKPVKF
jgi:uncharacterized damage-inducible protein DinB